MTGSFLAVGWDAWRVPVPAGAVAVPDDSTLRSEIADAISTGRSVDLHLSGATYSPIGILGYVVSDGGAGLRLYGNEDGSTRILGGSPGMPEAASAGVRIGSEPGEGQDSRGVSVYNLDIDGEAALGGTSGAIWGLVCGSSYSSDPRSGNIFDIHIQGNRVQNTQISALIAQTTGGSDGVTLHGNTVNDTGKRDAANEYGEGIYVGTSSALAYSNFTVSNNHVFNVLRGEGIEFKPNSTNGVIEYNLVHSVAVNSGGAITAESGGESLTIRGNRVYDVSTVPEGFTGAGILLGGSALVENNIVWGTQGAPLRSILSQTSGGVITSRHNTLIHQNNEAAYGFGGNFGTGTRTHEVPVLSENDLYSGTLTSGPVPAASSLPAITGTSFKGPETGDADAGDGPGSGFEPVGGAGYEDTSPTSLIDIKTNTRSDPSNAGAIGRQSVVRAPDPTVVAGVATARGVLDANNTPLIEINGVLYFGLDGEPETPTFPVSEEAT